MTSSENGSPLDRRSLLAGVGTLGVAVALPAASAQAAPRPASAQAAAADVASSRRYPPNRPGLEPYGLADTHKDLWPRKDNSFVLPLELRPRDKERGTVWMRDTYVNCFTVQGRPLYVATGTTRVPGLEAAGPWNDGIFVWVARSLRGPWSLVDTTGIRPGAEKGKVWSPEFAGENRPGRTVVAAWQEYWHDDRFGKRGQAWAPELHYFRGTWYIVACMGDHSRKVGSFMLVSEGGIEGPYRLVEGNREKPFGDPVAGGPDFIEPGAYHHIDGSLYTERDDAWLVLHNHEYAKFRDDMEDIVPTTKLPRFQQQPYSPEPYLEGAYVLKHGGKYYLLHAAWNRASLRPDGSTRYAYDPPGQGRVQYQYDAVVAVADRFEGPYSKRWTAGVGAGHNNFFVDGKGRLWATFFRNPAFGHWSDPSRIDEAAVPGVVRVEWTGPKGNRLYVKRRNQGRPHQG
ncbi:family 43 glycosylhydrolase [Streptomyces iconiensis]|uniref:Family 43 glycosylhydrolase n=1 Tax=Streptomyces iconiensis TaxID=1384038 RepID=A0ABT6ZV80_9ACTN|nr:family 43 glycosylhydrolase [Streptomyces iconiensis]MDJ1132980.1 family 43 glycosylhydrolase [Streptomyces iconiensis]